MSFKLQVIILRILSWRMWEGEADVYIQRVANFHFGEISSVNCGMQDLLVMFSKIHASFLRHASHHVSGGEENIVPRVHMVLLGGKKDNC